MPAGTYADPFILNSATGSHSTSISFTDMDIYGGFGLYPVAFARIDTTDDLRAIQALAPGKIAVSTFYDTVTDPDTPDENNEYNQWFSFNVPNEMIEAFWDGMPLWLVFIDFAQDYSLSNTGTFSYAYEIFDVVEVPTGPSQAPGTVAVSEPTTLAPASANIFTHFAEIGDVIVIAYGSADDAHIAILDITVNPPALSSIVTVYSSAFFSMSPMLVVSDTKAVFLIQDFSVPFPYLQLWYQVVVSGGTLNVGPASTTPTAFSNNNQMFTWEPFNDGTGRGIVVASPPGGGNAGVQVVQADGDGVLLDGGAIVNSPTPFTPSTYIYGEGSHLIPGDPDHIWLIWFNGLAGPEGTGAYTVARCRIDGLELVDQGTQFEIPSTADDNIYGGNYSNWIAVSPTIAVYPTYPADRIVSQAFGAGDLGTWFQVFSIATDGTPTLVDTRCIEVVQHEAWKSTTYQEIDVESDLSFYRGTNFWTHPSVLGDQLFFWGSTERIQPAPPDDFNADFPYISTGAQLYRFTVDETGMQTSILEAMPSAMTTFESTVASRTIGNQMIVSFYANPFVGGDNSLHLVVYTLAAPNLAGQFRAGRRSFWAGA